MKKTDWDNVIIDSRKEYIIVYQWARGKFTGKRPAQYIEVKIPKYSMKWLDYIMITDDIVYNYKRIKEIREDEKTA